MNLIGIIVVIFAIAGLALIIGWIVWLVRNNRNGE